MAKEMGDFQTPMPLVRQVLAVISTQQKIWKRVLEPTCGRGNFIKGILESPAFSDAKIWGVEVQQGYLQLLSQTLPQQHGARVQLIHDSIFEMNFNNDLTWDKNSPLLIIGNPPWVTNATLGALNSANLPQKGNLKGLNGLDALTGNANFDIAESIWLKLISELKDQEPTIALLCKTSVARNVLAYASQSALPIANASIWRIDSRKWFGAAVDSCLFCVEVKQGSTNYTAPIYRSLTDDTPETTISVYQNKIVSDVQHYLAFLDGKSPLQWRQGVKHDAASIMELNNLDGMWVNKLGETVELEADYIFPLLKSSDLYNGRTTVQRRAVIITQRKLGEDTAHLEQDAPRLWNYLQVHSERFSRRKSSIYKNKPAFSLFGIGDYSFAAYKVAISGMYKSPRFRLITPIADRPIMLDDTCYFIPCKTMTQAAILTALLSHPLAIRFVNAIVFPDSKRPITKKLLQRIDQRVLFDQVDTHTLITSARNMVKALDIDPNAYDWQNGLTRLFDDYSVMQDRLLL